MKAAFETYKYDEQEMIRSALNVLNSLRFFDRLDQQLIQDLAGRTLASNSESDLVEVCRENRHRRAYVKFLENETAELVKGPDSYGDND